MPALKSAISPHRLSCALVWLACTAAQASTPTAGADGPAMAPCLPTAAAEALRALQAELRPQGLRARVDCGAGAAPTESQGLARLQVQVVDGLRAWRVVRGPLADGQPVDMGTAAGDASALSHEGASGLSPDVHHNRRWLRALLQRHGFATSPEAWWRLAWQPAAPSAAAQAAPPAAAVAGR